MRKRSGPGKILNMAIGQLFKKPATIAYPKGEMQVVKDYRGKLWFDPATCINCNICVRNCPSKAITIINEGTKEDRRMRAVLDVGHCIFCCQCVDTCPRKSLTFSQNIDLSNLKKDELTVDLVKNPVAVEAKKPEQVAKTTGEPVAQTTAEPVAKIPAEPVVKTSLEPAVKTTTEPAKDDPKADH